MLSREQIQELTELLQKATPAPWSLGRTKEGDAEIDTPKGVIATVFYDVGDDEDQEYEADDESVATVGIVLAARNLLPALLSHIDTLTQKHAALVRECEAWRTHNGLRHSVNGEEAEAWLEVEAARDKTDTINALAIGE